MKYPYISKLLTGEIFLHYDEDKALSIKAVRSNFGESVNCIEARCKNITAEYLANTYGEVKSKEHAEFIVELALNHGIEVVTWPEKITHFNFQDTYGRMKLNLIGDEFCKLKLKQITIPLPHESKYNDSLNENGDNLIFGGDDKCDEALLKTLTYAIETAWTPKVGDKAIINNGAECTIKCIDADMAWVKLDEGYASINKRFLSEYRTPEMELSHDVAMIIVDGYTNKTALEIANEVIEIVSDFITKKPQ